MLDQPCPACPAGEVHAGGRCQVVPGISDSACSHGKWTCPALATELVCSPGAPAAEESPVDGYDGNCDGYDFDGTQVIFLKTNGDDGANGTTPALAVRTFGRAIARATEVGRPIVAQVGTYPLADAPAVLSSQMEIYGGFRVGFQGRDLNARGSGCEKLSQFQRSSILQGGRVVGMLGQDVEGVILDGIRITTVQPPAASAAQLTGANSYGMVLVDSDVTLRNACIEPGPGGDGYQPSDRPRAQDGNDGGESWCDFGRACPGLCICGEGEGNCGFGGFGEAYGGGRWQGLARRGGRRAGGVWRRWRREERDCVLHR